MKHLKKKKRKRMKEQNINKVCYREKNSVYKQSALNSFFFPHDPSIILDRFNDHYYSFNLNDYTTDPYALFRHIQLYMYLSCHTIYVDFLFREIYIYVI